MLPPFGLWLINLIMSKEFYITSLDNNMNRGTFQGFFTIFLYFLSVRDVRPRSFFSTSFLGTIIWCPQPIHFRRKSAPTRMISHSLLPHGCGFFSFTISPTAYLSILYSFSTYACHLICHRTSSVYTSICSNTEPSPCCIRRSALASIGVVDLLMSTSLFPL